MIVNSQLQQTRWDLFLDGTFELDPMFTGIKIPGGTQGMKTYLRAEDVPEAQDNQEGNDHFVLDRERLNAALEVAKDNDLGVHYMLNIQDTIESQLETLEIVSNSGTKMTSIILGTEMYLEKWRTGDTQGPGVAYQIVMADYWLYLEKMVPILRREYPDVKITFVGASHDKETFVNKPNKYRRQEYRESWNIMLKWFMEENGWLDEDWSQVDYHIYIKPNGTIGNENEEFSYSKITTSWINDITTPLITEMGVYSDEPNPINIELYDSIYEALDNDMKRFGIHVLYHKATNFVNPFLNNKISEIHHFSLYNNDGGTPKLQELSDWHESKKIKDGPTGEPGPTGTAEPGKENRLILNTAVFKFFPEVITSIPKQLTHVRGFSPAFDEPKVNGLLSVVSDEELYKWADWVIDNGLKVIWTLFMTKDRTFDIEIEVINKLIQRGVEISHFQMGGEFWLRKYFQGDLTNIKVSEKVTIDEYKEMLDSWIPLMQENFPEVKIMLLGCSHQFTADQLEFPLETWEENGATAEWIVQGTEQEQRQKFRYYRPIWNHEVLKYIEDKGLDCGLTVHYYAGYKSDEQPENQEDAIFEGINWDPFINQLRSNNPEIEIIVPESGWLPFEDSESELAQQKLFYEAGVVAIGENGIMGLHSLMTNGGILLWYRLSGITVQGQSWIDYFKELEETPTGEPEPTGPTGEPEPTGPTGEPGATLIKVTNSMKVTRRPPSRIQTQILEFSDGTEKVNVITYSSGEIDGIRIKPSDYGTSKEVILNRIK